MLLLLPQDLHLHRKLGVGRHRGHERLLLLLLLLLEGYLKYCGANTGPGIEAARQDRGREGGDRDKGRTKKEERKRGIGRDTQRQTDRQAETFN